MPHDVTMHQWHHVTEDPPGERFVSRLKVPGGWVYYVREYSYGDDGSVTNLCHASSVFVPDPHS